MGECSYNSMSPSTPLPAVKKGSTDAMVHKERPKIKIIHIIAPEIIKTDVANFRELVQRLTGKQQQEEAETLPPPVAPLSGEDEKQEKLTTQKRLAPAAVAEESELVQQENIRKKKIKCEVKVEEGGFGYDHLDHTDLWMDLIPGGFLSFLEEDVFQGMTADLFQSPLGSSRMDFVGEMHAS